MCSIESNIHKSQNLKTLLSNIFYLVTYSNLYSISFPKGSECPEELYSTKDLLVHLFSFVWFLKIVESRYEGKMLPAIPVSKGC